MSSKVEDGRWRALKWVLAGLGCLGLCSTAVFVLIFGGMGALLTGMLRSDPIVSVQAADEGVAELAWTSGGLPEEIWLKVDLDGPVTPWLKGTVRVWAGDELIVDGELELEGSQAMKGDQGHFTKFWTSSPTHAKGHIRLVDLGERASGIPMRAEVLAFRAPDLELRRLKVYVVECPGPVCL